MILIAAVETAAEQGLRNPPEQALFGYQSQVSFPRGFAHRRSFGEVQALPSIPIGSFLLNHSGPGFISRDSFFVENRPASL